MLARTGQGFGQGSALAVGAPSLLTITRPNARLGELACPENGGGMRAGRAGQPAFDITAPDFRYSVRRVDDKRASRAASRRSLPRMADGDRGWPGVS